MYTPTIGIEVHVELKTNKKVFNFFKLFVIMMKSR